MMILKYLILQFLLSIYCWWMNLMKHYWLIQGHLGTKVEQLLDMYLDRLATAPLGAIFIKKQNR